VAYSYAILSATALDVQKEERWLNDAAVQKLQCTNKWVKNFLTRSGMRKRKITRDDKKTPPIADIIAKMKEGQAMYIRFGHSPGNTWNMDETCVTWAIGPVHMYVPADQQRASNIGIPNTKLRITAILTVNGLGEFAPTMFIIKHSVSSENKPDQSTMKVIKNLYERNAKFGSANGWELLLWSKTMTIKGITADHKCWYLRHKTTHHIITSQYKAWNDTVRMMMWIELVINPVKERDIDKKLLLWFDNCGCHKTAAIEHIMSELGINVACLPPNMTAILQVLDLVVNGPLKAHIRNNRANKIVQCFKEYKALFDENARKDVGERAVLNFVAPKPDMMECIDNLIQLFGPDGDFQKQKFKDGVISAFMKTGTIPCNVSENGVTNFVEYKEESICGTMKIIPLGTQPSNFFDIPVVAMNEESTEIQNAIFSLLDREDFGDAEDGDDNDDDYDDEMGY
jgi:DDE superfamily endonuclease